MLGDLFKATVGLVIDVPLSVAKDITGLSMEDDELATKKALDKVAQNLHNAVEPEDR